MVLLLTRQPGVKRPSPGRAKSPERPGSKARARMFNGAEDYGGRNKKTKVWQLLHRLVEVGRDLWDHQVQPLLKHGHLQQCAQDLVQVAF